MKEVLVRDGDPKGGATSSSASAHDVQRFPGQSHATAVFRTELHGDEALNAGVRTRPKAKQAHDCKIENVRSASGLL
jgi:hypothetical protein